MSTIDRANWPQPENPQMRFLDDRDAYLALEHFQRLAQRRDIYGATPKREGLCAFDAYGMDVIEGRA